MQTRAQIEALARTGGGGMDDLLNQIIKLAGDRGNAVAALRTIQILAMRELEGVGKAHYSSKFGPHR